MKYGKNDIELQLVYNVWVSVIFGIIWGKEKEADDILQWHIYLAFCCINICSKSKAVFTANLRLF